MNKKFAVRALFAILCVALLAPLARATQLTLTGDASVDSSRPNANLGSLSNLYVGNGNTSLLQFSLSSLPAGTTSSQVESATLFVFVNRVNTGGAITVQPVTGSWAEASVTDSSIPSLGSSIGTFSVSAAGEYVAVDVTAQVQAWITAPSSNYGLALSSSGANIVLDSKENDQTAHPAILDVTLVNQGPQGPIGLQGPVGPTGAQGIQGVPGPAGVAGATGAVGATGPQGPPVNFQGTWNNAANYPVGAAVFYSGSSYIALQKNLNVAPGTNATDWALLAQQGATGLQGPQGNTGVQGNTGATGAPGATGAVGATGAAGTFSSVTAYNSATPYVVGQIVSCVSTCGTNGSSYYMVSPNTPAGTDPSVYNGPTGPWIEVASVGSQGIQGNPGPQGNTGATGAPGATGAAGPVGPTGVISSVVEYNNSTPYTEGQVVTCGGTSNCAIQGSSYYLAYSTVTGLDPSTDTSGKWIEIAAVGATGSQGLAGPVGATGPVGPAATVSVGTTTTGAAGTSASVTNVGNSSAAILDFTIPQGASGTGGGILYTATILNPADTNTYYLPPIGKYNVTSATGTTAGYVVNSVVGFGDVRVPQSCTVKGLYVRGEEPASSALGNESATFTVQKNGVDTSMACTVSNTATLGDAGAATCQDTTDTFSVVAGDYLEFKFSQTSGTPYVQYSTQLVCQ